jgi:lycopene beta-cyclase
MARGKRDGLLIAGGGLAGSLAAVAMARGRPEVPLLLVEEAESFGGADRLWCFLEDEVSEAGQELIEPLIAHRWPGYYVAFPGQSRKFKAGVAAIRTADIDRMVRETLRPDQYRLGTKAVAVRDNELVLLGGEKIKADGAIDARGAANLSMLDLGWRKSVARDYLFAAPHQVDRPVLIDATVDQYDGYRFMQCIPFSERRMRIEDSYLSDTPDIDLEASGARLDGGARVAKFGLRGGFFHPWSGSTLPDAVRTAMLLATQREFEGAALHDLFEREANTLWRNREFYRSFNTAIFKAGPDRRRMVEELYQSDPALISRFHSENTGMLDRMRLGKIGR